MRRKRFAPKDTFKLSSRDMLKTYIKGGMKKYISKDTFKYHT